MTFRTATSALKAAGGMAHTRTLLGLGATARELKRARDAGEIVRPRQGLYALPATSPQEFHAAAHGGVPAGPTAARLHGLWVLPEDTIHVWMGADRRQLGNCAKCCLHWSTGDPEAGTLPSIRQTLSQIVHCSDDEAFFAALESALRQGLLSDEDRAQLRNDLPRRLHWLVDFARDDADSGLESIVRLRLHRIGIDVRTQIFVHATGRVDLLIGDRLLIEIDGKQNHDDRASRHKDLLRDALSAIWGYETLRFDFAMIIYDWDLVEHAIVAKITAGAHLWPRG